MNDYANMETWLMFHNQTLLLLGAGRQRETVSKPTTYGMVLTVAGVRRDYRETKKISWSIKEGDFARLMSFPSSSRQERISMMISSCT